AQLPDNPVGGLHPAIDAVVDLGVLLEDLQRLGELPLAGDGAAVSLEPRLIPARGDRVDPVGLWLRRVVPPQLGVRVWPVSERSRLAQRRSVGAYRDHGAGGEIGADADHVAG